MSGLVINSSSNVFRIAINGGWSADNLQGRTLTVVKNGPGSHQCKTALCAISTFSIYVESPESHEHLFTRLSETQLGCHNVECDKQKVIFTTTRAVALIAVENLIERCPVLRSYQEDWLPKLQAFLN